jgi:signal peptidase II
LVADLASKQWIKRYFESAPQLRVSRKIEVIKGYMNLIYATNKGGAWGILQGEHESLRRPFFLVVSVAAIVFIISLYRKLTPGQHALKWGLPLVLGGALGNLFDRIVYGWVIDFIDVYTKVGGEEKHWPTFNVADVSICVGVGLMAIDMFTSREKKGDAPSSARNPQPVSGGLTPASAADLGAGLGPRPPREPGSEPPSSNSAKD